MDKLQLVLPSEKYKESLIDYKKEFMENNENIDGSARLDIYNTFEEWYRAFQDNLDEKTVRSNFVPSTTYLAVNNVGKLIGMVDIRHRLNYYLFNFGGHIGYSVRKSERKKGYATEILHLALEKCIDLNLNKILVTCNKDNIPSSKVIINNGGKLENEVFNKNRVTQRYWIAL